MEDHACDYCTGTPSIHRKELMYTQSNDYKVFLNECHYLEDNIIGGTVPHTVYGIKIHFCPMCGRKLEKTDTRQMEKETDREHAALEHEMRDANLADLMTLYKREDEKYVSLCHELVRNLLHLTDEGKGALEAQCALQQEATTKVAVAMANLLTRPSKQ